MTAPGSVAAAGAPVGLIVGSADALGSAVGSTLAEAVGRVDLLDVNRAVSHYKADGLDLTPIFAAKDIDLTRHMEDAVQSLAICLAADESVRSGQPVKL